MIKHEAGYRAHRWVVERTHSWLNRFRRLLVRWEKWAHTYIAMLHLACGLITWRETFKTRIRAVPLPRGPPEHEDPVIERVVERHATHAC